MEYIIVEILDAECENDPKASIFMDGNGNVKTYQSFDDAKTDGLESRISKFRIYLAVSDEIELPYDPDYDDDHKDIFYFR